MAHNQFDLLQTQFRLLADARNDIYLHIDERVSKVPIQELREAAKPSNIFLVKRHRVQWGMPSQVEAEMELYRSAYSQNEYSYYHLLSGTCLPIKSQHEIHDFFSSPLYRDKSFLRINPTYSIWDYNRVARYSFAVLREYTFGKVLHAYIDRIQDYLKVDRIRARYPIYRRGENWASLPHRVVQFILSHASDVERLIRFSVNSDEVYKQLLIVNSAYKNTLFSGIDEPPYSLWEIDWSAGGNHPKVYGIEDLPHLLNSDKLFARKFSEESPEVISSLANHILSLP